MKLTIINNEQVDQWIKDRVRLGRALIAVKGDAPLGATYDDGDLITQPVSVAWKDMVTGELIDIKYMQEGATP